MVIPPDFFGSYAKQARSYMSLFSPIIFIVFLFAPTVPSDPIPRTYIAQCLAEMELFQDKLERSMRYIVDNSNYEAVFWDRRTEVIEYRFFTMVGAKSFLPSPYRPPTKVGTSPFSWNTVDTP